MKKILVTLLSIVLLSVGASQALVLEFINLNLDGLLERLAETHFNAPGNDFAGAIFWLPAKSLFTSEIISLDGEEKHCRKMVRGMYYNSQRGERLWPMDVYTLQTLREGNASYDDLEISGAIYTTCDESTYGIFGQIEYNRSGTESFVTAGVKLDYLGNWLSGEFADSFEYFNNTFPLGYIVDNVGGIGFVGGILSGHDCLTCLLNENCNDPFCTANNCSGDTISELFVYSGGHIFPIDECSGAYYFSGVSGVTGEMGDIQWGITVQGNVGLSQSLDAQDRQTLLGNYNQTLSVINVPKVNISTLINKAKKNAQKLCRGRKNYANFVVPAENTDSVLCFAYDSYDPNGSNRLTIDFSRSDKDKYLGKTIVLKNADLHLQHSMSENDEALDIFVDNGNIYFDRGISPTVLQTFSNEGYPTSVAGDIVTSGLFLKGNFIVNGLILGNSGVGIAEVPHKLYVHGKLNSFNTPVEPSRARSDQVAELLGSASFSGGINLQRIFTWYCNPITGIGSDGVSCFSDQYADSSLVIIGQDFESELD